MSYSQKMPSKKARFYFFNLAKLLTLFSTIPLHADNSLPKLETIALEESSGDYVNALKTAKKCYASALEGQKETSALLETIHRLENKILFFGSSRLLFDEDLKPRDTLLQLLQLLNMPSTCQDLPEINAWAQKNLLRQGERWEAQPLTFEPLRPQIKPLLMHLGFVEETAPNFNTYQGALVHGALLGRLRLRLSYLVELWKQGIRFKDLYFLTGERPLILPYEDRAAFFNDRLSSLKIRSDWQEPAILPQTEKEMVELIWEQSDIPQEMRQQVAVYFISAPMKTASIGQKLLRPDTEDTVALWLETNPAPGSYLAVTNAPYTNRQDLVIRTLSPKGYTFDTVGSEASPQEKMAIFLDELARYIFQISLLAKK